MALLNQRGGRYLFTALPMTALREGLYTAFFLTGTPTIKLKLSSYGFNNGKTTLAAGICSGIGVAVVTQSLDTVKTKQQANTAAKAMRLLQATQKIYSEESIMGFFKGGLPRGLRVVTGLTIMGYVKEKMEAKLSSANLK